ncbi:hypothetical protein [Paucisalibacillus sp. EB02]|uniref:hypothetical protein n=1 Tax=Paucisalibacillus sp. EB02 TaxID=1347087 RepID=UPI0004B3D801|nr:hypothetical protein [Paucisalibacillus sp. EB02]
MSKEKFHIQLPSEDLIQSEITTIVANGLKPKESFYAYLKRLYKQIGLRNLLPNRWEEFLIIFSVLCLLIVLPFNLVESNNYLIRDFYMITFLLSPLLFMVLSIYQLVSRIQAATYEVEMVCKYNLYQVAAFRMLVFSIIAIVVNILSVLSIFLIIDGIHLFRALMISISSLFLFSIIFLYAYMKRQSRLIIALVICGWIAVNIGLSYVSHEFYLDMLINVPIIVYAIVLGLSVAIYFNFLRKLVYLKPVEGVR